MYNSAPLSAPGGRIYRLYSDLASRPHLLIAGATGSGKSVTVNGIIYSLLATRSPAECGFILLDPKKVELSQYARLPHTIRYASDGPDMISALDYAVKETENRFSIMARQGVKMFNGPDLYVIVDELADLVLTQKAAALEPLQRLSQIGRAARVHLIACSQCVLAKVIPTEIKVNFSTILGLRTATAAQSRFLVASAGCELLPDPKKAGKSIGYLRDGADLDRYELYMYPETEIAAMINYWTAGLRRAG